MAALISVSSATPAAITSRKPLLSLVTPCKALLAEKVIWGEDWLCEPKSAVSDSAAAGQGGSCGFGMRGQKSRSGPGVGFEGGQMPLYRRLPKLHGIAGGMKAGLPKYVPVNLKDTKAAGFEEGAEVSWETSKERGLINPSGRDRKLPLKIPGDGDVNIKLNFKAHAFTTAAKEKLEAAGCTVSELPGQKKWMKPSVLKNLARAGEYFAKKKAAAAAAETISA